MSCNKDGGNGKQVVGELRLGTCMRAENHELDLMVLKDLLQKLECETAQAVAVGSHNLGAMLVECTFQKGFKTGTLPVEA